MVEHVYKKEDVGIKFLTKGDVPLNKGISRMYFYVTLIEASMVSCAVMQALGLTKQKGNEDCFLLGLVLWYINHCRLLPSQLGLQLCRGVRPPPPTSVLDMTLNNLMVRFQQCWSFGECGVPLRYHRSQVHSGPEW